MEAVKNTRNSHLRVLKYQLHAICTAFSCLAAVGASYVKYELRREQQHAPRPYDASTKGKGKIGKPASADRRRLAPLPIKPS